MKDNFISLIFLAAGEGKRMKSKLSKQFALLGTQPVVLHSYEKLSNLPAIKEVILAFKTCYQYLFPKNTAPFDIKLARASCKNIK